MTRIRILRRAVEEFERWVDRARADNPRAAEALAEEVIGTIERLARSEFEGTEVILRSGGRRVHRWPAPPFVIYYVRQRGELRVLRIHHAARRPITR